MVSAARARQLAEEAIENNVEDPRLKPLLNTIEDRAKEGCMFYDTYSLSKLLVKNLGMLGYTVTYDCDTGEYTIKW